MMKAPFCISVDNKWDRHISLPWREPNLPDWLTVEHFNPSVDVSLFDLSQVVEQFKEHNQKEVNRILSLYY